MKSCFEQLSFLCTSQQFSEPVFLKWMMLEDIGKMVRWWAINCILGYTALNYKNVKQLLIMDIFEASLFSCFFN